MMRRHVFFFSVIWLIFCPVGYTPTKYNIYRGCISQPGARIWNFHESQEDQIIEIHVFYSGTDFNSYCEISHICIAKLNSCGFSPRDLPYLQRNNEMFRVTCVKFQPVIS